MTTISSGPTESTGTKLEKIEFLNQVFQRLIRHSLIDSSNPDSKVIEFKQPHELKEPIDRTRPGQEPVSNEVLLDDIETVLQYSVKTGHPRFLNQLYAGHDVHGLAASLLVEFLNTNVHTFEVAPVFSLIEEQMIDELGQRIGFPEFDGLFVPGGSIASIYGVHLARYRACPDVKRKGNAAAGRLVVFASEDAHYSVDKSCSLLGIGLDNLIKIKTDEGGRMRVDDLVGRIEQVEEEGGKPFLVMATSGTTVLGAYDPLDALADVCQKHKLWLHADAAWGGAVLFSAKHRRLMKGVERCDSLCWDAHKMMRAPLQCATFMTRHKGMLQECNSMSASYLFQKDKAYDVSKDMGDKTIQCGRKADAVKLWMMWRAKGDRGWQQEVERVFDLASYFASSLAHRDGFRMVIPHADSPNICFWYIPTRLRGQPETAEWWQQVSLVAPSVKSQMQRSGSMLIGYQPMAHRNWVNFFRLVITCNDLVTEQQLDTVLAQIEQLGERK